MARWGIVVAGPCPPTAVAVRFQKLNRLSRSPEEQLGRLLVVRTMKLGSYGVSAEPFRSASAGGVVAPFFRRCRPLIRVKVGRPFSRVRARVRYFPFFPFTSSPVWRNVLIHSLISVKALSIWVHAFASSREGVP